MGGPDLEERLGRLEAKLEDLAGSVRRLERRLSAPDEASAEPGGPSASEPIEEMGILPSLPSHGDVLSVLTQVGRSCLVLGGAFLVRALTDSGMLPRPLGAALGLAYAVLWILLAGRAAARGRAASGEFLGITAVVIAYPLVVETSTRMAIFSPAGAAAILAGLTALCLGLAWRRGLPVFAWAALAAAIASSFVLALVTHSVEPFAAALLVIGIGSLWLAYSSKPWKGPRWPAAAAADLLVLWAALQLAPSGQAASRSGASLSPFLLLAFALPFLYLGSFAVRTLARRRSVVLFDAVQGIAALAVGLGGAAFVVADVPDAQHTLGASALVIAAGCYGVAFVFVEKRQGHGRNFLYYASLALLLTLWGSVLAAGGSFRGPFWSGLALVSAILATRFGRTTLAVHSAVYALAAAWQTGLTSAAMDSFVAPAGQPWAPFVPASAFALGASAAAYVLLAREAARTGLLKDRIARVALAIIVAFGTGGLAVTLLRRLVGVTDPGATAAIRTAVLAAAALALAAAGRRAVLPELAWLAYAVLVLGAGKLLLEDLPGGRPATLFLGFAFYGAALLLAPSLLRRTAIRPAPTNQ